jgi:hypothetical protein
MWRILIEKMPETKLIKQLFGSNLFKKTKKKLLFYIEQLTPSFCMLNSQKLK